MKTLILYVALLISGLCLSQTGINYKALVKDASGNILAGQDIIVGFTITNDDDSSDFYSEIHNPVMTDSNGIFVVNIGEGVSSEGDFSSINWSSNSYSLQTEISTGGLLDIIDMGTTPFKAVPFSLTSKKITNAPNRTLEVAGTGQQKIRINSTDSNISALELMGTGARTDWKIQNSDDGWLDLMTSDNDFNSTNSKFSFHKDGKMGVNTFIPQEELHVTGTIRSTDLAGTGTRNVVASSNGNLIPDSQTKYLSIGPAAFVPYQEGRSPRIANDFLTAGTGPAQAALFVAPLNLPQGATITSFKCYFVDNVNPNGLTAAIISRRHTSTTDETFDALGSNSVSSSSTLQSVEKTTFSISTINNAVYSYGIQLDSFAWNIINMKFYSILISYTLP